LRVARISTFKLLKCKYLHVEINIRLFFAYNGSMFPTPSGRKTFVVQCKKCRRDVPSGREEFPFQSITVECPLCGELRRYLPSEVFLGRPDNLVIRQLRAVRK
jgi:endogenous inhibitor of DNA gyrase (YacG/DUF329 family)